MSKFCLYIASDFLLHVGLMIFVCERTNAQTITIQDHHPSHYIILVHIDIFNPSDPSTLLDESSYRTTLTDTLLKIFEQNISLLDYKRDVFTLFHLGIFKANLITNKRLLKEYDFFKKEYIRSIFIRKQKNVKNDLKHCLIPEDSLSYSILSWAKQFAFEALLSQVSNTKNQHTFLIMITGGSPRISSNKKLFTITKHYADSSNVPEAEQSLDIMNGKYIFTPIWSDSIQLRKNKSISVEADSVEAYCVEAYEVICLAASKRFKQRTFLI